MFESPLGTPVCEIKDTATGEPDADTFKATSEPDTVCGGAGKKKRWYLYRILFILRIPKLDSWLELIWFNKLW